MLGYGNSVRGSRPTAGPWPLDPGPWTLCEGETLTSRVIKRCGPKDPNSIASIDVLTICGASRGHVMRLLRTSSTLKRLFPGPGLLYKPCAPVTRRVNGLSQGHTATTTRPPWAHQTRFASSDPNGSGQDDDPYKVLGVSANVAQSKIQPAFHALALKLHPDRMPPGASDEEKKKRKREFQDVS